MGLAAALIGLIVLGGGGYAWSQRQRAARAYRVAHAVNEALADAERLQAEAQAAAPGALVKWSEAFSAAQRARSLLAQGEPDAAASARVDALVARIDAWQAKALATSRRLAADRALLVELESVRGDRAVHDDLHRTDAAYAAAFRRAGLDFKTMGPAEAGRWIAARSEPAELAGYLDDWASVSRHATQTGQDDWRRLVAAARAADPDPWRDALRARLGSTEEVALSELRRLANDASALDAQPPSGLVLLARALRDDGHAERPTRAGAAEGAPFARLHPRHPGDFWTRFELALVAGTRSQPFPQLEEAVRHLTAATAIRPGSASAHDNLGRALRAQRQMEEAIAEFREALRLKPDSSWVQLAFFKALKDENKLDEEITSRREAVRLQPGDAWVHANLAGALKAGQKFDEAIAEFREAIRLKPDMLLAHVELGGTLWDQGKRADALMPWREAVRLNPDDAQMHLNLGAVLHMHGKLDEAIAEYREAIRLKPDHVLAHHGLGNALNAQGKRDEANAEYREASRIEPGQFGVHRSRGNALYAQKKPDEAIAEYREAIRLNPNLALAHFILGNALYAQKKFDEAVAEYREAIRLKPDDAGAHLILGNALYGQKKFDEAAAEYREATRLTPDDAGAHLSLGKALYDQKKFDEAAAEYREAIRLKPDDVSAETNLGWALRAQGKLEEALAAFRRAGELAKPDSPSARTLLGRIRETEQMIALAVRLPAVLNGKDTPSDAAEIEIFALLCRDQGRYAAAARLLGNALAADPRFGEDRRFSHRYNAACYAAVAGCGKSRDDPLPDDPARAALRQQALDWLKAEHAAWAQLLESDEPQNSARITEKLNWWQQDPRLAGVRDPELLEAMAEEEKTAWRSFWSEVERLAGKARGGAP